MFGHTPEGDEVWSLHLAFLDAAKVGDISYGPDPETVAQIEEFTLHNEAELALTDILAVAAPPLPPSLEKQAVQTARRVWSDSEHDAREQVDAWLTWYPGCGAAPPYTT